MNGWKPHPDWVPLAGAEGQATVGVWRATGHHEGWIVKRLRRPPGPDPALDDPRSFRWWQREIAVAESDLAGKFRGLAAPESRVEIDEHGATLWSVAVEHTDIGADTVAAAIGTFASLALPDPGWFTQHRLADRVAAAAQLDPSGETLRALARPGSVATDVWQARAPLLAALDSLPHVLSHGDALPRNLLRHDADTVTAIDWGQLGYAPIGADLASYTMWVHADAGELLRIYLHHLGSDADPKEARTGLSATTALIAVSRAIRTAGTDAAASYQQRLQRALPHLHKALDALA